MAFRRIRGRLVWMIQLATHACQWLGTAVLVALAACTPRLHCEAPPPEICALFVDVPTVAACAEQTVELTILATGQKFDRPALRKLCVSSFEACQPKRRARQAWCKDHFCGYIA